MDKDYDDFVQRMGSFDMDLDELPKKEEKLTHLGVTRKAESNDKVLIGKPIPIRLNK